MTEAFRTTDVGWTSLTKAKHSLMSKQIAKKLSRFARGAFSADSMTLPARAPVRKVKTATKRRRRAAA